MPRRETVVSIDEHRLRLTNLDKVIYPQSGTTKAEVAQYYAQIAPVMLPHCAGRPATRKRWVDGVGTGRRPNDAFFAKDLDAGTPAWVVRAELEHSDHTATYPVADERATLVWFAQIAALEVHVPQWRLDSAGRPRNPDRLVLDLDPGEGVDLATVAHVAGLVRQILTGMGLESYPVTSGSKGIHLYAALDGSVTSEQASALAKELARSLEADHAELVLSRMTRAKRPGKVFLDWSQNNAKKTTIAPYSLRGTALPRVAAPRTWAELEDPGLAQWAPEQVLAAIAKRGDPMAGLGVELSGASAAPVDPMSAPSDALGRQKPDDAPTDSPNRHHQANRQNSADRQGSPNQQNSVDRIDQVDRLTRYRSKRDPSRTPEPIPAGAPEPVAEKTFVIQEHHASRLHWDFRLSHQGVLISWALPKGVPTDPAVNHLAVPTEDHPLSYATFAGTIPAGEYGAGEVTIWDSGSYTVQKWREGAEIIVTLTGAQDGGLAVHGPGRTSRFALIRTGGPTERWLIHLMRPRRTRAGTGTSKNSPDAEAPSTETPSTPTDTTAPKDGAPSPSQSTSPPNSESASHAGSATPPAAATPSDATPSDVPRAMLATAGSIADLGEGEWSVEMKWDGVRAIIEVAGRSVRVYGRSGLETTTQYPELADLAELVHAERAVLDGEIVALDAFGRPSFTLLQPRMHATGSRVGTAVRAQPVHLMLFDVLSVDGHDLIRYPYHRRRQLLETLVGPSDGVLVPPALDPPVQSALELSAEQGLEGVVAKRRDSAYFPGRRSRSWIKIRHLRAQEVVVGGWRPGKGARDGAIGSLLLGVPDGASLRYVGRVGTGFTERQARSWLTELAAVERSGSPFTDVPAADARDALWTEPVRVAEVTFAEWSPAGRLRHPVWRGWRPDKQVGQITVED